MSNTSKTEQINTVPTILGVPQPIIGRLSEKQQLIKQLEYAIEEYCHEDCIKKIIDYIKTEQKCPFCKTQTEHDVQKNRYKKRGRTSPVYGFPNGMVCNGDYYD